MIVGRPMRPEHLTPEEIAWLAGFYEGEGHCCYTNGRLEFVLPQRNREPLTHAQALIGGTIYILERTTATGRIAMIHRLLIRGPRAEMVLRLLWPHLSRRRRAQIDSALAKYAARPRSGDKTRGTKRSPGQTEIPFPKVVP